MSEEMLYCWDCGEGFRRERKRGPKPRYCPICDRVHKLAVLVERVARYRAKRKTSPPEQAPGGGSISEGGQTIPPSKLQRKSKSISKVSEGREGLGNQPLAPTPFHDLELLKQHNKLLYNRIVREFAKIEQSVPTLKTPGPVIHGGNMRKKSR